MKNFFQGDILGTCVPAKSRMEAVVLITTWLAHTARELIDAGMPVPQKAPLDPSQGLGTPWWGGRGSVDPPARLPKAAKMAALPGQAGGLAFLGWVFV